MTALGHVLEDPGDLGQQVSTPGGELAQRAHRGGLLVAGQLPPLRAVPRLARDLGHEHPARMRALIVHRF
jgi:hypothetical protein